MQTETEIKLNTILCGKSEEQLKKFSDNFFGGIITDPPYEMDIMGKSWDSTGIAYFVELWKEVLRISKPGAFLFCFGGTRTHHRVACAIEDAGWIIKDEIDWIYGEGFPKSTSISKQLDKEAGVEREVIGKDEKWIKRVGKNHQSAVLDENCLTNKCFGSIGPNGGDITAPVTSDAKRWDGYGTGLKPAHEPIIVAMKPLEKGLTYAQNAKKWDVAGLNIDGGRIGTSDKYSYGKCGGSSFGINKGNDGTREYLAESHPQGRWPSNVILSHSPDCVCVGTKIINEGALEGGYNYSGKEYKVEGFIKDNKPQAASNCGRETVEVWACVPNCPVRIMDSQSGILHSGSLNNQYLKGGQFNTYGKQSPRYVNYKGDSGGASRFFYCAKAKRSEKEAGLIEFIPCVKCGKFDSKEHTIVVNGEKKKEKCTRNNHPTVKPLDLMIYLINLIKMPLSEDGESNQVILDPFCGSGTTLVALEELEINYIGIDQDFDNVLISTARIGV